MKMGFPYFSYLPIASLQSALPYHTGAVKWGTFRGMVKANTCFSHVKPVRAISFKLLRMLCHKAAELTWRKTVFFCKHGLINVCDWILPQ